MDTMTSAPVTGRPITYAGFWKRFVAYLIDGAILLVVSVILLVPLALAGGIGGAFDEVGDSETALIALLVGMYLFVIAVLFILQWLYHAVMESTRGATFGKMALGIRVTDMEGRPISFARASGRHFAKMISSLTFGIGYVIAGFSQQKQALHDIIAGCLVVNNS